MIEIVFYALHFHLKQRIREIATKMVLNGITILIEMCQVHLCYKKTLNGG